MTQLSDTIRPTRRPRIVAIDLVRVVVVAAVIATHIMATGPLYNSPTSGAVWMLSHISRNLFILLTAVVLFYNYGPGQAFSVRSFLMKRFTLIAIPYAVWSLIYQVGHGIQQHSVQKFLGVYIHNFVTAGAMYHLYFLLLTMQLYLLFPVMRYAYEKVKKYPWQLLIASLCLQLIATSLMHYGPHIPFLEWWLAYPDSNLLSYQFYVVAGVLIASHATEIGKLALVYANSMYRAAVVVAAGGIALYEAQIMSHISPDQASAVFQPYLVVESMVLGAALLAASFQWSHHGARFHHIISKIGEDSFGIYLGHVFLLTYLIPLQPAASNWVVATLSLLVGVPLVYLICFIVVEFFRHTRLSLFLTGRHSVSWFSQYRRTSTPTKQPL